jgi:hypothetical protein
MLGVFALCILSLTGKSAHAIDLGECLAVPVDIKPQSCPNPFNMSSNGVIAVAIVSAGFFDATEVDPYSVQLAGVDPIMAGADDVATPFLDPIVGKRRPRECLTDGPDGLVDLVLHFRKSEIKAALGPVTHNQPVVLPLTGELFDGTCIYGEDVILIKLNSMFSSNGF